jgi:gliding motility-associated-like protein
MFGRKFLMILLPVVLFAIPGRSLASHLVGGNLTYKCIDSTNRIFEVELTVYRDCAGISLPGSVFIDYASTSCSYSSSRQIFPIAGTGKEISPKCSSTVTTCGGGTFPGIQEWVYRGNITLPSFCSDWRFSWVQNARNNAISTISSPGSQNFYVEAFANNLTPHRNISSPVFSNKPVAFVCINQSFTYNHGAVDPNGDSLVYSLVTPKTGTAAGNVVTYLAGFSASSPLSSTPPVSINTQTGDVNMKPTALQQTVMAVLVRKYRGGVQIGSVVRDMQVVVINCNLNSNPFASGINGTTKVDTTTCAGTPICFTVSSTDSNAADTVQMSWNSGIPSASFNISGTYRPTGTFCWTPANADVNVNPYFFTVTVKDNFCPLVASQTKSFSVKVVARLTASLGADQFQNCAGTNTLTATPGGHTAGVKYLWSTADTTSSISVSTPGSYWVRVTNSLGCVNYDTLQVIKNIKVGYTATIFCQGVNGTFTDTSSSGAGIVSRLWDFGDATGSTATNPAHTYATAGNFNVKLVVTDANGCKDSVTKTITVRPKPSPDFTAPPRCFPASSAFTDASTIVSGSINSWSWNFGDAGTSALQNPTHAYAAAGSYSAKLVVQSTFGCKDSVTKTVTVNPKPAAVFTADTACSQSLTTFTDLSTIASGSINTYAWTFGDGNTSTSQNPAHAYASGGSYSVKLKVTSAAGCADSIIKSVTVKQKPVAGMALLSACSPSPAFFQDSSFITSGSITAWKWDMNNGVTSVSKDTTYAYPAAGTYQVKHVVTSNLGCSDSIIRSIPVYPAPVAKFTSPAACRSVAAAFIDSSTISAGSISSWLWNFGDAGTSSAQNPAHSYATSGTFQVKLVVFSAAGCKDSITKSVVVSPLPVTTFTADTACFGFQTSFTNTSSIPAGSIASWSWDFADGHGSGVQNPTHTYASGGPFNVELIATSAAGCKDSITKQVLLNPRPVPDFSPISACFPTPTNFSDLTTISAGSIASYHWNFGDLTTSTLQNPVHSYATGGTFSVKLTVTSAKGCIDSLSKNVSVYPVPTPHFKAIAVCRGLVTTFTDSSYIASGSLTGWSWDFGDGNGSTSQNPTHTYGSAGTFNVKLIVTSALGCKDSITMAVVVHPRPVVDYTPASVCFPTPTQFNDMSTIASGSLTAWSWSFGNGNFSTAQHPTHTYASGGSFNVKLVVTSNFGCQDSITKSVGVHPLPVPVFTFDTACNTFPVNFTESSTIPIGTLNAWSWDFGDGGTSLTQNPSHAYTTGGTYSVKLRVYSAVGCNDSISRTVTVNPKPVVNFNAANVCLAGPTNFTDSTSILSGSLASWQWSFGDGNTSTSQSPVHTYAAAGTYQVKLKVTSALGCTDSIIKAVVVHPKPVVDFTPLTACFPTPTTFTDLSTISSGTLTSRDWDFGDATVSALQNPVHSYAAGGNYIVKLVVTSALGCKDSNIKTVPVYPLPVPDFSATTVCKDVATTFTNSSTIPSGTITGWSWDFGNGNGSASQNPTHTYSAAGTYSVELIVTSSFGCRDSITKSVTVHPKPVVDFSTSGVCTALPANFTDASGIATGSINAWYWAFGDGDTSVVQNPAHTFANDTTYQVKLVAFSALGCKDSITKSISASPLPVPGFSAITACDGSITVFTDSSAIASGNITGWSWDLGDGDTSLVQHPTHTYAANGTYNVKLRLTSSSGCTDSITQSVFVNPTPTPNFIFNTSCNGDATQFTDSSFISGGSITTWLWNFGDATTSGSQDPSHIYAASGTYNVKLKITSALGCSDSITKTITVFPKPVPGFSPDSTCFPTPTVFSDQSTISSGSIASWQWDFGDTTFSTLQDPIHAYAYGGSFTVKMVVTSAVGCRDSLSKSVPVFPIPVPSFSATNVCRDVATTFTDSSSIPIGSIASWQWYFGDGNTSAAQNPSHTYAAAGSYNVKLVLTSALGCMDSLTKTVTVYPKPVPDFSSAGICLASPTAFTDQTTIASGSIVSWTWTLGDGNLGGAQNPSHTYATTGTYNVKLKTVSGHGCSDSITKSVTINPKPLVDFTPAAVCYPTPTTFTDISTIASGSISTRAWDFGDSTTATGPTSSHTYLSGGNRQVKLVVTSASGCKDSLQKSIPLHPVPVPDFSGPDVCRDQATNFTDASTVSAGTLSSWSWNFGDGDTSASQNPSRTYAATGSYQVKLIVYSNQGCSDSITKTVLVHPRPVPSFSNNVICFPLPTTFTNSTTIASGTVNSWKWDFGDTTTSGSQHPTHNYALAGTFSVKLRSTSALGCTDSTTQSVTVYPKPVANFGVTAACAGFANSFTDSTTIGSGTVNGWSWDFGDASAASFAQNPTHTYAAPGIYNATLIAYSNSGCTDTIVKPANVNEKPTLSFSNNTACYGDSTTFSGTANAGVGSIAGWSWNFGDGNISTQQNPKHFYATSGTYQVKLIVTSNAGCRDSITQTITVKPKPVAGFNAPPACFPFSTTFTDTTSISSGSIISWEWNFGDAAATSMQHPVHSYSTAGIYSVTLIVSSALGCTDTVVQNAVVNPKPAPDFSAPDNCFPLAKSFTDSTVISSGSINTWQWDFGDATTSLLQNPAHNYAADGTYTIKLVVTSAAGCSDSISKTSNVHPAPQAGFYASTLCFPSTTTFTSASNISSGTIVSYIWDFGDSTSAFVQNPLHNFPSNGVFNVKLKVVSGLGCIDSNLQAVVVHTDPVGNFITSNVCYPGSATFLDSSYIVTGTITAWSYSFGDSSGSTGQNATHSYAYPGTFYVTLTVTSSADCSDTITKAITVYPKPVAAFGATTACNGFATNFSDSSSVSTGSFVAWSWDFGDGNTDTVQNANHIYTSAGSYNVKLVVTTASGCQDSITKTVVVHPRPQPAFGATTVCFPFTTSFADSSLIATGTINSWSWKFGDGGTSNAQNPSYTYLAAGTYSVKLIAASALGCSDSTTRSVTVNPRPVPGFSAGISCFGFANNYNDTSTISSGSINAWNWDFGDATTSASQNPAHTYAAAGSYNTKLVVFSALGCKDSITKAVTVHPKPVAGFSSTTVCHPDTTVFTNSSTVSSGSLLSWSWNFGDGGNDILQNTKHKYANPGTYSIKMIVTTNNGCKDSIIQSENVNAKPVAGFSVPAACFPFANSFTDTSTISAGTLGSWSWNFGDGDTSNIQHPSHAYSTAGNYLAKLTVRSGPGCTDTTSRNVVVSPKPSPGFNATSACNGFATQFTNSSTVTTGLINSWQWNFGDTNTSNSQNPSHLFATEGSYNVKLIVTTVAGCYDSVTNAVVVHPRPAPQFTVNDTCYILSSSFTDQSTVVTGSISGRTWHFGDGGTSSATNPSHSYAGSGTYSIKLIAETALGCVDSVSHNLSLYPLPVPSFSVSAACSSFANSFTDSSLISSGSISTWSWNFGDATGSAVQNPSHIYSNAGSYTAKLILTSALGCKDSTSRTVTVHPNPVAGFSATSACHPFGSNFTDSSTIATGTVVSWNWDFGDTTFSTNQNPAHTYALAGSKPVKLVSTSALGCKDSITKNVIVHPKPTPDFGTTVACHTFPTVFTDSSGVITGTLNAWSWQFGDGGTSSSQNPTHTYANPGTYNVKLIISTAPGCIDSITKTVTVNPNPVAEFNATTACFGFANNFNDSSFIISGTVNSWNWTFGDADTAIQQNPSHNYSSSGTYNVKLVARSAEGCSDSITHPVIVNPKPVANFITSTVCNDSTTIFTNQSTVSSGSLNSWSWRFGDDSVAFTQHTTHVYDTAGSYAATLIVSSVPGCSDSISRTVIIHPNPQANFGATVVCHMHGTQFTDSSTVKTGSVSAWSWDFGDGVTSTAQNPLHTYLNPGDYIVKLKIFSGFGCVDSIVKDVVVNPNPVVNYNTSTRCLGHSGNFNDISIISGGSLASWSWDFGDGDTALSQHAQHLFAAVGNYQVKLRVTSALGCSDSLTTAVMVNPNPSVYFNASTACEGHNTIFQDSSVIAFGTITTWKWEFGDSSFIFQQNPAHLYQRSGTFMVKLIATAATGCSDSTIIPVTVNPRPAVDFHIGGNCHQSATIFADSTGIVSGNIISWSWNFGDGSTSTNQDNSYTYADTGSYDVTLVTVSNSGCADSITKKVVIHPLPHVDFSSNDGCEGERFTFTDLSVFTAGTPSSWSWNFGDGNTSSAQNGQNIFVPGTYNVKLVVTDSYGCIDSTIKPITVFEKPAAAFSLVNTCINQQQSFSDLSTVPTGSITGWSWNFGDGDTSANANPFHNYAAAGNYTITHIVITGNGCRDTSTQNITINPKPQALFAASKLCINDTAQFTDLSTIASGSIVQWNWNFGDLGTSSQQHPTHNYLLGGQYSVTLIVTSAAGCSDTLQEYIQVFPIPVPAFTVTPPEVCLKIPVNFTDHSTAGAGGTIISWLWDFGDSTTSTQQHPQHLYLNAGTYNVTLTVTTAEGCRASFLANSIVTVASLPVADFRVDTPLVTYLDPSVTVVNTSTGSTSFSWDFDDGFTSNDIFSTFRHTYDDTGTYDIKLYVINDEGCRDTMIKRVKIIPHFTFFVPNAFTPDQNNLNENFTGTGLKYGIHQFSMQIYDRWGQLIFESNHLNDPWNGQYFNTGLPVQQDVYVYLIVVKDWQGRTHFYRGDVTLLR